MKDISIYRLDGKIIKILAVKTEKDELINFYLKYI